MHARGVRGAVGADPVAGFPPAEAQTPGREAGKLRRLLRPPSWRFAASLSQGLVKVVVFYWERRAAPDWTTLGFKQRVTFDP